MHNYCIVLYICPDISNLTIEVRGLKFELQMWINQPYLNLFEVWSLSSTYGRQKKRLKDFSKLIKCI